MRLKRSIKIWLTLVLAFMVIMPDMSLSQSRTSRTKRSKSTATKSTKNTERVKRTKQSSATKKSVAKKSSNTKSNLDVRVEDEDKEFKEDLYLTDSEFFQKYFKRYKPKDSKFLYSTYVGKTQDPEVKIYILRAAMAKGVGDDTTVKLLNMGLAEGLWNQRHYNKLYVSQAWKVRAAAAYLIGENASRLNNVKYRAAFSRRLLITLDTDKEERVRGIAAIALGKLFANIKPSDPNKTFVLARILNYLENESPKSYFLYWAIVKSLGHLKDERSFYPLLQARRIKVNKKVTLELSRSINAILNR